MKTGTFYGVGLGPGDPGLVTLKALEILQSVHVIFSVGTKKNTRGVSGTILDALPGITARRIELEFTMSRDFSARLKRIDEHAELIFSELKTGLDCAFTTIGDPMTYSTCSYLLRALKHRIPELENQIIPGVNSWSALAAATGEALVEDEEILRIIPGYRNPEEHIEQNEHSGTSVFLKTYRERDNYLDLLKKQGMHPVYGANLGLENEFVSSDPAEIRSKPEEYLSILIGKHKK